MENAKKFREKLKQGQIPLGCGVSFTDSTVTELFSHVLDFVWIVMEHTTRDGKPRLLSHCNLPLTAAGTVNRVVTNFGLFEVTGQEFLLIENAPGYSPEEIGAVTEGRMVVADDLMEFRLA